MLTRIIFRDTEWHTFYLRPEQHTEHGNDIELRDDGTATEEALLHVKYVGWFLGRREIARGRGSFSYKSGTGQPYSPRKQAASWLERHGSPLPTNLQRLPMLCHIDAEPLMNTTPVFVGPPPPPACPFELQGEGKPILVGGKVRKTKAGNDCIPTPRLYLALGSPDR